MTHPEVNHLDQEDTKQYFKNFDNLFTSAQLQETRQMWLGAPGSDKPELQKDHQKLIDAIVSWEYANQRESFTNSEIHLAVYTSDTHLNWQKFRVSMKGLTTKEKIYMLTMRYENYCLEHFTRQLDLCIPAVREEFVRIHNYIGALRRGGQLDADYCVVK